MSSILQQNIGMWGERTFGKGTPEAILNRLDQELLEFFEDPRKELPDVQIMLYRYAAALGVDVTDMASAKMEINYKRQWVSKGDGTGYHVGTKEQRLGLYQQFCLLQDKVREIAGQFGNDKCHIQLKELFAMAGATEEPATGLLPREEFLMECGRYHDTLAAGIPLYTSLDPRNEEISRLRKLNSELQKRNCELALEKQKLQADLTRISQAVAPLAGM